MEADDRWQQHFREHETAESVHRREHATDARALEIAAANVDRRLDELNQLRAEVVTDRGQFVRMDSHRADLKTIETRINAIEKLLDKAEGAVNTWRFIAVFLGFGGVLGIVSAIFFALTAQPVTP